MQNPEKRRNKVAGKYIICSKSAKSKSNRDKRWVYMKWKIDDVHCIKKRNYISKQLNRIYMMHLPSDN